MIVIDFRSHEYSKTCHLRPGDCINLYSPDGSQIPGTYLVCSVGKLHAKLGSSGLYEAESPVFLVNISTGEAINLPHLSSRLTKKIIAEVHVTGDSK